MIIADNIKSSFLSLNHLYKKWIANFKKWVTENEKVENLESVLEYLVFLSDDYSSTSLRTFYSM